MGQNNRQNGKKLPKWQEMAIGPWCHVEKLGEAGRSLTTSKLIFLLILCTITQYRRNFSGGTKRS